MTSDSSYVHHGPKEGRIYTRRPTGIDDFRCGIAPGTPILPFDADLQNNRIDNLRPMTRAQFTQHEYRKQAKK
jgi:hypothetical protein